jgi:hypothetical protein
MNAIRKLAVIAFGVSAFLGSTAGEAQAKTSVQLVKSDPRGQYFVIKRTLMPLLAQRKHDEDLKWRLSKDRQVFDFGCSGGRTFYDQFFDRSVWRDLELEFLVLNDLAQNIALLEIDLEALVPKAVWQEPLSRYENQELDELIGLLRRGRIKREENALYSRGDEAEARHNKTEHALFEELVKVLEEYRRSHPSVPRFIIGDVCEGAGEFGITIYTSPPGADVRYIPELFFSFCKTQGLEPDDPNTCARWRRAPDDQLVKVVGDYHYLARWPDGIVRKGQISFSEHDECRVLVLHKDGTVGFDPHKKTCESDPE